jgi:hypothetical protein
MKKSFSTLYPYLAWWCENHGYMETGGNTDYGHSLVVLLDDGGTCWESGKITDLNEAYEAAEKYLKEVEIPERFGEEVIAEIESL